MTQDTANPATQTLPTDDIDQVVAAISFDTNELVPVIAQQHDTGEILMMAWMNADAVRETLQSGKVCYWSRSRGALWRKGETSGQHQRLIDFRWDCDADTVLALVDQTGVACHTGRQNCFFNAVRDGEITAITEVAVDPDDLYGSST